MIKFATFLALLFAVSRAAKLSSPINNSSVLPECMTSEDCPGDKACVSFTCVDPCADRCGSNTECQVKDHVAACSCTLGFSGSPFAATGCVANSMNSQIRNFHGGTKKFHVEATFTMNWFEAFMYCQSQGQQLATILSKKENDQMLEEIKKTQGYIDDNTFLFWTSGTDLANEGVWYWMSSGTPLNGFKDWHNLQPDNFESREHCLGFSDRKAKKWHDADCKKVQAYFVCQTYE